MNWMTATGFALIAGGIATLVCFRKLLWSGQFKQRDATARRTVRIRVVGTAPRPVLPAQGALPRSPVPTACPGRLSTARTGTTTGPGIPSPPRSCRPGRRPDRSIGSNRRARRRRNRAPGPPGITPARWPTGIGSSSTGTAATAGGAVMDPTRGGPGAAPAAAPSQPGRLREPARRRVAALGSLRAVVAVHRSDRPPSVAGPLERALIVPGSLWRRIDVRAETGSTNADVADAARRGEPEGLVVVAERQLAGRGRRDRNWASPPRAGLTLSVLLRPGPGVPPKAWGWLPLLAGVALRDAVRERAAVDAALKWPTTCWSATPSAPASWPR